MSKKYFIYFFYNKENALLYIGKTTNLWKRWGQHKEEWNKDVCKIGICECIDHAAMDILESYYIAKNPSIYNIEGLAHGYTALEIPGLEKPTFYTRSEFIQHFMPKRKPGTTEPLPPIHEQIQKLGNTIIEVDSIVNLFDKELLKMDLDRVYFKCGDLYLVSKFSVSPGQYIHRKNEELSFRTNERIRAIRDYLNNPTLTVTTENGITYHTFELANITRNECKHQLGLIDGQLYTLYQVVTYYRGERLEHVGNRYPQTDIILAKSFSGEDETENVWTITIKFKEKKSLTEQPLITKSVYEYDIVQLYSEIQNRNRIP